MNRLICDLRIWTDEYQSKKCGRAAAFFFAGFDVHGRLKVLIRCRWCGDVQKHWILGSPPNPGLRFRQIPASQVPVLLAISEIINTTIVQEIARPIMHRWRRIRKTVKKPAHYKCDRCDRVCEGNARPTDSIMMRDPVTGVRRTCDEEIIAAVMES